MVKLEDFWSTYVWATILIALVIVVIVIVIVMYCLRKRRRRGYEELRGSSEVDTFLMMSSVHSRSIVSESALLNCQYYLRSHPEYDLVKQLPEIGSRVRRSWFTVAHNGIPRLMFLTEKSKSCCFSLDSTIEKTLQNLMHVIDHPYVLPIEYVGLSSTMNLVVMVQPLSKKGSLKDLLYKVQPLQSWDDKYSKRRNGLGESKAIVLGRQILEAIDYLKKQGIPCHNIHSGNIIMFNDTPRLAGFENFLFGYSARQRSVIDPFIKNQPKEKRHKDILTVLLFGHLLYEMSTGAEVQDAKPSMGDLTSNCSQTIREVLASIFYHPEERIPTLMEVQSHSCFVNVRLHEFKEMKEYSPKPFVMSSSMKKLLSAIKKKKQIRGLSKRQQRGSIQERSLRKSTSSSFHNMSISSNSAHDTSMQPVQSISETTIQTATTIATPPPPPNPSNPPQTSSQPSQGRGALLSSIRQGQQLKKAPTNDRSTPNI
eukprot:m.88439 g.88439  ORF g.88439 m.88439 type:complete len:483 (+) comp8809_c0_seq1:154-1602(+)